MSDSKHVISAQNGTTRSNSRRVVRNRKEASKLEKQGYTVEANLHSNGAYFAYSKNALPHEIIVGRIFAENGLSFRIDPQGNKFVKLPDGRKLPIPSLDGNVEGFTHEIANLSKTASASKVADAIEHSYKEFKKDKRYSVQADVAITITTTAEGGAFHREHLSAGVEEFRRRVEAGETKARPIIYLHVDEYNKKIYHRDLYGKKK